MSKRIQKMSQSFSKNNNNNNNKSILLLPRPVAADVWFKGVISEASPLFLLPLNMPPQILFLLSPHACSAVSHLSRVIWSNSRWALTAAEGGSCSSGGAVGVLGGWGGGGGRWGPRPMPWGLRPVSLWHDTDIFCSSNPFRSPDQFWAILSPDWLKQLPPCAVPAQKKWPQKKFS